MATKAKKKVLITGGAGFMGRWVSKNFLDKGHKVWVLDNLANSSEKNIEEFRNGLAGFIKGDIKDVKLLSELFSQNNFDICVHLAAAINVQDSIDNPSRCFTDNIQGTFNVLEQCREYRVKMVFMSSALVYQTAKAGCSITEAHPLSPSCPYAVSKIFGENLTNAYYKTYKLPVVILRPFSIYGPWQRRDSEGGVMSIFIDRKIKNLPLQIYGDGEQSRDFFYIEDCAEFIYLATISDKTSGQSFNAGSGQELKIKNLAKIIAGNTVGIKFIKHHHPHAEIMRMKASSAKAKRLLNWQPKKNIGEGIAKTTEWIKTQQ